MAAGAVIFYCGFRAGNKKEIEFEDPTTYVCPTKLEPAPVQEKRDKKEDEEVKSYFYQ